MQPIRAAAADVGSNAIRFLAVEAKDDSSWRVLHQTRVPLRLGRDVFLQGELSRHTFDEAARALAIFQELLRVHDIFHYRAVATSALRESGNGHELVAAVRHAGLALEIIDGSEEARLVYTAARHRLQLSHEPSILADLGGGSLEVSLIDDQGISQITSLPIGAVRLLEATAERSDLAAFERLVHAQDERLRDTPALRSGARKLIATGGNIEALARISGVRASEDGVSVLPTALLSATASVVADTPYSERMKKWQLQHDRADVIVPAAVVYLRVARLAGTDQLIVPFIGVKEGIVYELLGSA